MPTRTRELGTRASIRSRISPAALLVKVRARILSLEIPVERRWATRRVITRVLPEPAPASTKSGPSTWLTASRWAAVKSANKSIRELILGLIQPSFPRAAPGFCRELYRRR